MKHKKKSLLWQIEHPALVRPSFLFGTMHVRDNLAFQFQDMIYGYLQQCDALATEYDLSKEAAPALSLTFLLPEGQKLTDFFRPGSYQKLRAILLKTFQVDLEIYIRFAPLFIITLISESLLEKDRPHALDLDLWHYAGSLEKKRVGIETLEEQLIILQKIPLDYQIKLLRALGRKVSRFRKASLESTGLYQNADPQRLYQTVRRSSQGLRKSLLFRRNRIMAERINLIIQQQPTFCAVGAGHLAGKEGVIRLLKKNGFKLSPIPMV